LKINIENLYTVATVFCHDALAIRWKAIKSL